MHVTQVLSSAAGDIGASLGNCLANINKYQSRKEFLTDFGQTAAVSDSLTYVATQMPLIGQLFVFGAFGYFTAKIYSNDSSSKGGKNSQMNKLIIQTTTNVGSGLGGVLLGQALIRVPTVGALIGGFIGGLLGGLSSSIILDQISQRKFQNLYQYIKLSQQNDGHWQFEEEILNQLALSQQVFKEQLPNNLKFDESKYTKWTSIICYSYCTIYQTQLDILEGKKQQSVSALENDHFQEGLINDDSLENVGNNDFYQKFPEFIELACNWIIQNKCLIGLSLPNTESLIKCIFLNQ